MLFIICYALMKCIAATCGLSKVDAVIILDASTSVTERNFQKMRDFAKDLVDKADVDSGSVRFGVLIYSTEVEIQFHLNEYRTSADIKAAIDLIPYIYGSTNSADALQSMHTVMFTRRNGDRPEVENIAFMITDGVSNINSRRTVPEAESARQDGIHIYSIGIGLTDTRELDSMASVPASKNSFNVQEFEELEGLADDIFGGDACGKNSVWFCTLTCLSYLVCHYTVAHTYIILSFVLFCVHMITKIRLQGYTTYFILIPFE